MNQSLQLIIDFLNQIENVSVAEKDALIKAAKKVKSDLEIADFKLERTEKVKRTTTILLEETIEELEQKRKAIEETNVALQQSLRDLKAAQTQLIQSEKMASLGELTAGIAHEIQNPLNFVNNYSEVTEELVEELLEERKKEKGERDESLEEEILGDIKENLIKINHHGNRASSIVKGMLEHSRTSTGKKELTDINALTDEYLRLSYHGLRAKDKSFNADFQTNLDPDKPLLDIVPQDIGRVILNLINNAFYACNEKRKTSNKEYMPLVVISTKKEDESCIITISDNGTGIPKDKIDKIFQPFFTTKPTGQGTGLGLSLSYDIIKAHDGMLKVESNHERDNPEKESGTIFTIILNHGQK